MNKLLTLLILVSLVACSSGQAIYAKSRTGELEIMSYNVENLFDVEHDQGKNDWAFLPLNAKGKKEGCSTINSPYYRKDCFRSDWTREKMLLKIGQIKQVLTRKRERVPHVLALSEIENKKVVALLAAKLGYEFYLVSESPDHRGIDLALLWSADAGLTLKAQREHRLEGDYFKKKPTRNILEVEFLFNGNVPLTFFVNHWPSLGNPTVTRLIAAKTLRSRVEEILKVNPAHTIVALGDFNTIDSNHPHPFKDELLRTDKLMDVHQLFMEDRSIHKKKKKGMPLGSFFYAKQMTWNHLDRIFVSKNLLDKTGLDADIASYRIYAPKFITDSWKYGKKDGPRAGSVVTGIPKGYNHNAASAATAGYSDHFPLLLKLRIY